MNEQNVNECSKWISLYNIHRDQASSLIGDYLKGKITYDVFCQSNDSLCKKQQNETNKFATMIL
jgi:hypothetical protein